jgi:hypothetical protein
MPERRASRLDAPRKSKQECPRSSQTHEMFDKDILGKQHKTATECTLSFLANVATLRWSSREDRYGERAGHDRYMYTFSVCRDLTKSSLSNTPTHD